MFQNFWTWLFHSFILGTVCQCLCTCCRSRGLRAFLSLLLVKNGFLWAKSCTFPVKISFGQWSCSTLSENPILETWICKMGISESSFRHKHSRLFFFFLVHMPLCHSFNFLFLFLIFYFFYFYFWVSLGVKALETQGGCCCRWWERISDIAGW